VSCQNLLDSTLERRNGGHKPISGDLRTLDE
jgi:hypothetical protein